MSETASSLGFSDAKVADLSLYFFLNLILFLFFLLLVEGFCWPGIEAEHVWIRRKTDSSDGVC